MHTTSDDNRSVWGRALFVVCAWRFCIRCHRGTGIVFGEQGQYCFCRVLCAWAGVQVQKPLCFFLGWVVGRGTLVASKYRREAGMSTQ